MPQEKCGPDASDGGSPSPDMDAAVPDIIEKSSKGILERIRDIGAAASKYAFSAFHTSTLPAAEEAARQQRENVSGDGNRIFSD